MFPIVSREYARKRRRLRMEKMKLKKLGRTGTSVIIEFVIIPSMSVPKWFLPTVRVNVYGYILSNA